MKKTVEVTAKIDKKLQWHQAFYAGIQIELLEDADKLIFENEHHIGTQPKEVDEVFEKGTQISD